MADAAGAAGRRARQVQARALPADTEARLASFAELVATAIANTESRASLARLAEEQAALRRAASWWQGVARGDLLGRQRRGRWPVQGAGRSAQVRARGPAVVFVGVSKAFDLPVGTRWEFQPGMPSAEVYRTGCSARVDAMDWSSASGPAAEPPVAWVSSRMSGARSLSRAVCGARWSLRPRTSFSVRYGGTPGEVHRAARHRDRGRGEPVRAGRLAPADRRGVGRGSPADRARSARR